MAIIYETQKDFEQDKLKEQSKDLYLKSANEVGTGLASALLGSVVSSVNTKNSTGLGFVSSALNIIGVVQVVRSFFTASKAHNLQLERERMGSQTVVLPPDAPDIGCQSCSGKAKHSQAIQPTTLLEQAEKRFMALARE